MKSDLPNPKDAQGFEEPLDLSGDYNLGVGARLQLSTSESVEVVEVFSFDHKYEVGLSTTFWPTHVVRMTPGDPAIAASLDGRKYSVSVTSANDNLVTLKLVGEQ